MPRFTSSKRAVKLDTFSGSNALHGINNRHGIHAYWQKLGLFVQCRKGDALNINSTTTSVKDIRLDKVRWAWKTVDYIPRFKYFDFPPSYRSTLLIAFTAGHIELIKLAEFHVNDWPIEQRLEFTFAWPYHACFSATLKPAGVYPNDIDNVRRNWASSGFRR